MGYIRLHGGYDSFHAHHALAALALRVGSLCGIVLEWRMSAHGVSLTQGASSPARPAAFNESFMMLAAICALALLASWRLRETPVIGCEGNDTTG